MMLKAFNRYLTELMYAEIFFPVGGTGNTCIFNTFRSRKQYIQFWLQLSQQVAAELSKADLNGQQRQYIFFRLQQAGKMFIYEGQQLVSHCNLLVFYGGVPSTVCNLQCHEQTFLLSFLRLQHQAWVELCDLCNSVFSFYQGQYTWQGDSIELLELGDALWTCGRIRPLSAEKTKRQYLRRLFALLHLPVPDNPCRRLGELMIRARPDAFISWLHDRYRDYWHKREE